MKYLCIYISISFCFLLFAFCFLLTACAEVQQMNVIEFEPHLEKAYRAQVVYGVGFDGYENSDQKSNVKLLGWKKGASTRHSARSQLVNIGSPRVLLTTRDGEEHLLPLKWIGEIPPERFNGKVFIRVYNLEEGLIHWKRDSYAHWEYSPNKPLPRHTK